VIKQNKRKRRFPLSTSWTDICLPSGSSYTGLQNFAVRWRTPDCLAKLRKCIIRIIVSSDLSPCLHVTDIASKAHVREGLILRTFVSRDIHLLKRAFLVSLSYERPVVEHILLSGHPVLHVTSMLLNQFNVVSPRDCLPLVTCRTVIA